MSRRRKRGAEPEPAPYSIRWHSFADITTPSVDIMSSPDPLNDSATDALIQPAASVNRVTRSITRSIRSDRFAGRATSPRKQTFELEVGDNKAPQRLLVTVETDGAASAGGRVDGTRRKLFQSSSPMPTIRQRERATTTVVPLKETVEDEPANPNATPRRRGRPRKSNGTPIPGAGTKRRAGTPIKRTPRRPRTTKPVDQDAELGEPKPEPTPKSTRRGRPPKKRTGEPSSEIGVETVRGITSATRGRKRRLALPPEESMEMTNELPEPVSNSYAESVEDNEVTLITLPSEGIVSEAPNAPEVPNAPEAPVSAPVEPASEADSDIWMATLDDDPTPRATRTARSTRSTRSVQLPSPPGREDSSPEAADFGYFPPAGSDFSSIDEPMSDPVPRDSDTIAQGEDFSMIFMDSLPSLRSSVNVPVEADFGDETSLIINNTLESLRQSLRKSVQQHEEPSQETETLPPIPADSEPSTAEPVEMRRAEPLYIESDHSELDDIELEHPEPEHVETMRDDVEHIENDLLEFHQQPGQTELANVEDEVPEPRGSEPELEEAELEHVEPQLIDLQSESEQTRPAATEVALNKPETIEPHLSGDTPAEPQQPFIRPPAPFSPNRILSPRWLRSPKKGNKSPLRHQLLKFKARQTDDSPQRVASEKADETPAPSPQQGTPSHFSEGQSNLYEDSFSEIPNDVLEAATPRRPRPMMDEADEVEEEAAEQELVDTGDEDEEMDNAPPSEHAEEPLERPEDVDAATVASTTSHVSQSERGRLPTPDDTPPQIDVEADGQGKSSQYSQMSAGPTSRSGSSPMLGSGSHFQVVSEVVEETMDEEVKQVEDVEYAADVDEDIEEAPEAPMMPEIPEILEPEPSESPESSPENPLVRPEVTPLNQMTSPLQEPHSLAPEPVQEKTLRPLLSPIVRAGRALQSVTSDPPSPEPREHQLRSPFRSSVTRDLGPPGQEGQASIRRSASPRRPLSFPPANQANAAPASAYEDPFASGSRHTGQPSFMEALERSGGYPTSSQRGRESPVDSVASSMHINPPDDVQMSWVANEGPISANLRGDVSLTDLAPHTTTDRGQSTDLGHQPKNHDEVDDVDENPQPTDKEEEEDDEMDLWEFEAEREEPRTARQQPFGNGRRGLPSPWTRQAQQSPQRDVPMSSPERAQEVEKAQEAAPSVSDTDRTEEAVSEDQGEEFSLLAQREAAQAPQQAPESANKPGRFDLSSFFSSPAAIPGKLAEKFLSGKTNSASKPKPAEAQPEMAQMAPAMPTSSMFPQVAQEFRPRANSSRGTDLFSSSKVEDNKEEEEHVEMFSVAQKQNFTPRPKQPTLAFFKSSVRSGAPTPPRMQLTHADIERWQQETASETSPEVRRPLLRPLPPKDASPVKSSLRSPLKPHTPGRVVEFTSSVLSPVEQAKARQMRRLSNSTTSQASVAPRRPLPPPRQTRDKENNNTAANTVASEAAVSDSSVKSEQSEPLSRTVWGREHWLFLDQLLQLRRAGPYEFSYDRCADRFLGKTVRTRDEGMLLERWHLDCVDAFKAEVGGWDEADLIRRLFSLIMGEEKRSHGVVERRPRRVMFH